MSALYLDWLLPQYVFLIGAVLVALIPVHIIRAAITVAIPASAFWWLLQTGTATSEPLRLFGFDLTLLRLDALSRTFALVFTFAATFAAIYAWSVRSAVQQVATLLYAGAAIGAVLAGDLVTLFIWWEGTALTSVFLIWARRTDAAYRAGLRYLVWQVASGVALFAGVAVHYSVTASTAFDGFILDNPAAWAILVAFGIKGAFPLLNGWLHDAYPRATVTGTVTMSIFTTKMAIYALLRGFSGEELLVYIGVVMALYPLVLTMLENDMRRLLTYALNSQLGIMVAGIGIGTALATNGVVAHATASVLYQGVLFMGLGAIILRTGSNGFAGVGGLARSMPFTFAAVIVGLASIASVPFFAGFASKSITIEAAAKVSETWGDWVWMAMIAASLAGVLYAAIKIPREVFLGPQAAPGPDASPSMLAAMVIAAGACLAYGLAPQLVYAYLPNPIEYEPITLSHLVQQGQLLAIAALAGLLAIRFGLWGRTRPATLLDLDWFYRGFAAPVLRFAGTATGAVWSEAGRAWKSLMGRAISALRKGYGPDSFAARVLSTGNMAIWIAIILGAALFANLLDIR